MSLKIVSALMTQRRFLPLWVAQTLGAFNDNLFRYALVALATYQGWTVFGLDNQIMVPLAAAKPPMNASAPTHQCSVIRYAA